MKQKIKQITFLSLVLVLVCGGNVMYGQIEVLNDNTVKVTDNITIKRNDTDNPNMLMNFDYDVPTNSNVYSLRISSIGVSQHRTGFQNLINGTTDYEVGIYNDLNASEIGNAGYPTAQGMYNRVYQNDFKAARGLRNFVYSGDENFYSQTYGTENQVILEKSQGVTYGSNNFIDVYPSVSGGTVYGVNVDIKQNYFNPGGAPSYSYGVKANIDPTFNGYAGYFQGDVSVFGTFYNGSDDRLKEDVSDIKSGLELINNLRPKEYRFKRDLENVSRKDKMSYGFIAQEVQEVAPHLVRLIEQEGEEKIIEVIPERTVRTENGERITIPAETEIIREMDGEPMYAIAYMEIIPFLVSAVQEQSEILSEFREKSFTVDNTELSTLRKELVATQENYNKLQSQLTQLIDCTNCDEIEIETRKIEFDINQLDMRLYPNPASDFVNLEVKAGATGLLKISVFNESGQLVVADDMMLIQGVNLHRMESSSWTSGLYHITTTFNEVTTSQKVVIE